MTLASGVLAPAEKLTAERDMLPVTGKPPLNALPRLAAPRPISSRLLCSFCWRLRASVCAADMLIRKIIRPISSAGGSSARQCAFDSARFRPGRPAGAAPVVWMPAPAKSKRATSKVAPNTTAIGARRAPMAAALWPRPSARSSRVSQALAASSNSSAPLPSSTLGM